MAEVNPLGPKVTVFGLILIMVGLFALLGFEMPTVGWIAIVAGVLVVIGGLLATPRGQRGALFRREMTQGSTPSRSGVGIALAIGGVLLVVGLLGLFGVLGGATEFWALPAGLIVLVMGFVQLRRVPTR